MTGSFRPIRNLAGSGNTPIANAVLDWTEDDVATLPETTIAVRVQSAGNVNVCMWGSTADVVFIGGVLAGETLHGNFSQIRATNTTAGGFTVFYLK